MLDGLLGRTGFYSKCKSLIKLTRTRIDVVRRKRNATQKFLRKDIADLLANGLESNAYGRAEGLITELILSSCYDFIDHVCEIILKHLPVLQKLRECPEECREPVGSLMFAAARFSDLPELRELRDLLQERYGSSLEYYVNQKLVENITPKPPSREKAVQLMSEIALEFSIWWDPRGFEERMSKTSATEENQGRNPGNLKVAGNKVPTSFAEQPLQKTMKDEVMAKKGSETTYRNKEREVNDRHQMETKREDIPRRRDDLKNNVPKVPVFSADRYKPPTYRENSEENNTLEAVQAGTSSRGKKLQNFETQQKVDRHREDSMSIRDVPKKLSQPKPDPLPVNDDKNFPSAVNNKIADNVQVRSMRKSDIPPPYVKPRKSKHKADLGCSEDNDTLTFKPPTKPEISDHVNNGVTSPENVDGQGRFTEIYYRDASSSSFTPRRRSYRRKHSHSRSMSTHDDDKVNGEVRPTEEERVVRRVSTSRRKHESRKGLQILFDDDGFQRSEEEKIIDKLLLQYCKKPSTGDPGKSRRKTNDEINDQSKSPYHKAANGTTKVDEEESIPTTSRSTSLPPRKVTQPEEPQKVFTRASSFQQDTPAKHVHPKLPDYDDLAARFAALRANKG